MRSRYICRLDEAVQVRVREAVTKLFAEMCPGEPIRLMVEHAMEGRLWDLEDILDLEALGL